MVSSLRPVKNRALVRNGPCPGLIPVVLNQSLVAQGEVQHVSSDDGPTDRKPQSLIIHTVPEKAFMAVAILVVQEREKRTCPHAAIPALKILKLDLPPTSLPSPPTP